MGTLAYINEKWAQVAQLACSKAVLALTCQPCNQQSTRSSHLIGLSNDPEQ